MAPERHLVRTQHSFAVEDLDDYALLEMRVTMTLRLCEELGLNENETTVGQLCNATLDQFDREQRKIRSATNACLRSAREQSALQILGGRIKSRRF